MSVCQGDSAIDVFVPAAVDPDAVDSITFELVEPYYCVKPILEREIDVGAESYTRSEMNMDHAFKINLTANPDSDRFVSGLFATCRGPGVEIRSDSDSLTCTYWSSDTLGMEKEWRESVPTDEAAERITADGYGGIKLSVREFPTELRVHLSTEEGWMDSAAILSMDDSYLKPTNEKITEAERRELRTALVGFVARLAEYANTSYGWSFNMYDKETVEAVSPMETPVIEHISRIPWLGVYGPSVVDDFGGLEYVLDTPAWYVEELDTGQVVIVKSELPFGNDSPAVDEYLLGPCPPESTPNTE